MKNKKIEVLILFFLLVTTNLLSQKKYPNAENLKNDVVITYDVVYDNELTEIQKKSIRYKKEIILTFNKNRGLVKYLSDNLNHQVSSLYDYDKKVFYWRTITKYSKVAVRYKFPKPWKKVTHQEGKVENIIDIPCEVYKKMIKGEERTLHVTKKFGVHFSNSSQVKGLVLKYAAHDKYLGFYTVTAKKIFYTSSPEATYSLKGFEIIDKEDQKKYFASRKSQKKIKIEKEIKEIGGESTKYVSSTLELELFKCKVKEKEIKRIEQMIKFQTDYYESLFKIKIDTIKIKLFNKFRSFKKVQKLITGSLNTDTGYYFGNMKTIYVYRVDDFLQVIFHEINHAIVDQVIIRVPSWINEGMAVFFEYFTIKTDGVSIKMQSGRLAKTKEWVKENKVDLKVLLNYSYKEWHNKNLSPRGYSYTVSYSFICYLYVNYPGAIGTILKLLKKGKNSIEAIEFATKRKIEFIEKDLLSRS